jgi:hypothetical protein
MKLHASSCSFLVGALLALSTPLGAQIYSSCDQWGNTTTNGYNIYNNIWGSGAGTQCLTVFAHNNWYVDANHPNTSGIKSYPNVERQMSINVDSLGTLTSTFAVTRPSSGSYATTYDIWYNNYAYEVMLWMNKTGAVGPIASAWDQNGNPIPEVSNLTVGGHTWNVYRGSNGSNAVFSFVRTSNTDSGTVDIAAISRWLRNNGWFGNVNLHSVQLGFEITSTSGNQRFAVTNFSVNQGTSTTLNASPTSLSFGTASGSQNVSVTSNTNWTASDDQSWISVTPTSGANNGTLQVSVTANTGGSRTGTVTVSGGGATRTISVTQSGSSTTADTYQAENATRAGTGTVVETTHSGYRGTGYINFPTNGGSITFNNVDGNGGGSKNLTIRYALGATSSRTANLVVNGTTRTITFNPTGAWNTWQTLSVPITLNNNSTNSIRIATTGADAGNVDEITVP